MLQYSWLLPFAVIVTTTLMPYNVEAIRTNNNVITKTQTFLTPLFTSTPGSVAERFYYGINFPKGHIAIKSFNVEVVDKAGNSVPLYETYLHHWAILRYFQHKNATAPNPNISFTQLHEPNFIIAGNSGICQKNAFPQYFGTGADSRKTSSFLPHPYGIEVGDEARVPLGYEEKWCLNVHAIDTRGVENRLGCIECQCDLYNVTKDGHGVPLGPDYKGGLRCCYDKTHCKVRQQSYEGDEERSLFVRYVVKWIDWDDFVIPLKVYIFDVTDTWKPLLDTTTGPPNQQHNCLVEYDVGYCSSTSKNKFDDDCNATKSVRLTLPSGGYLIYGMAHQHIGGIGATLYGEDGRILCSSSPIYGRGSEIGNEDGFVVGMSTCYSQVGSMKIHDEEMLTLVSKYDSAQNHTGVMGLFHIMVADKLPKSSEVLHMEALEVASETSM